MTLIAPNQIRDSMTSKKLKGAYNQKRNWKPRKHQSCDKTMRMTRNNNQSRGRDVKFGDKRRMENEV